MFIVGGLLIAPILVLAVIGDCKNYRVSNSVILFGVILGLLFNLYEFQIIGLQNWFFGSMIPIIFLGILFLFRVLGAGDIKLFSVIGGFFGPQFVSRVIIIAFFIGAVLSVIQLIRYRNLMYRLQYLAKFISEFLKDKKVKPYYVSSEDGRSCVIHFTVAIVIAVLLCLRYQQIGMG